MMEKTREELNNITESIIGCAIEVHKALGSGLLESAYEACMMIELRRKGFDVRNQVPMKVEYKGETIDCGYRMDILVENSVVVELKSVEKVLPVHESQLKSYLKLSGCRVGLLVNFNVEKLVEGIHRVVNNF